VKVRAANSLDCALPHASNIVRLGDSETLIEVVHFVEGHVPAVASALVEQSSRCRSFFDRGHNFNELVTQAEESVMETKVGNTRIAVNHIKVEGLRHLCDCLLKAVGNEGNLA
jgi:hypothetical protein